MSVATKPRRKPQAKKRKAESRKRTPARQRPLKNQHGVYTRPRQINVPLRKTTKATITLKIVEDPSLPEAERWRIGHDLSGMDFGSFSPCSATHDGYPSEAAAVDAAIRSIEKHLQGHLKSGGSKTSQQRIRMVLVDLRASEVWRAQRKLLTPGSESDRLSWPNSTSQPLPPAKPKAERGKRKGRGTCPDPLGHIQVAFGRLSTPPRKRQSTSPEPRAPRLSSPGALVPAAGGMPLDAAERKVLARAEKTIAAGLMQFREVGEALVQIRDGRLYREKFATFEAYCREIWNLGRQHAYRMIGAAAAVQQIESMSPIGDKRHKTPIVLPTSESQARPLARLDPEDVPIVWQQVIEQAPKGAGGQPHVTAKIVEEAVRQYTTPPAELHQPRRRTSGKNQERSEEPPPCGSTDQEGCPDEDGWLYEIECVRSQIIKSLSAFPQWPRCHAEMARILRQLADGLDGVT